MVYSVCISRRHTLYRLTVDHQNGIIYRHLQSTDSKSYTYGVQTCTGSHTSDRAFFSKNTCIAIGRDQTVMAPRRFRSTPVCSANSSMGYYIFIIMYHYSALFLFVRPAANEKKPHPAGFVAFLRAELSNHICSGGYTRYGTTTTRIPRILSPQTSDR